MRMRLPGIALAAILSAFSLSAAKLQAANLLSNGSFETVTTSFGGDGAQDLSVGSTVITGWTVITNHVAPAQNGNAYSLSAQDGVVELDLQGYTDSFPYGGMQQTISTIIGANYNLSFWVGVQNSVGSAVGPASVNAAAGATSQTFTNTLTDAGQQWQEFNLNFTASATTTTISLTGISTGGGAYIGLDNADVELVSAPEPTTAVIGLVAAGSLLVRRKRRV